MNFERLKKYLDSLNCREGVKGGVCPGSNTVIYLKHEPIFSYSTGYDDIEAGAPTNPDKLYNLYSCTKITTATAAMQLLERGIIAVNEPVSKYIPEFADIRVKVKNSEGKVIGSRPPKQPVLIRHLLTMTSGLPYSMHSPELEELIEATDGRAPTLEVAKAMARHLLDFDPGAHYQYSESLDVMGAVIEVATGEPFSEYVRKNIFDPLGMRCTTFRPDFSRPELFAAQYGYEGGRVVRWDIARNPHRLGTEYDGGGAGLVSSTNDYILLIDALANLGVGKNGKRILTERSVELMRTPALGDEQYREFSVSYNTGYCYCYGVRACVDKTAAGTLSTLGAFGWDGWKMCFALIDPSIGLAVFHTQHLEGFHNDIIPKLRNLIYYSLGKEEEDEEN